MMNRAQFTHRAKVCLWFVEDIAFWSMTPLDLPAQGGLSQHASADQSEQGNEG
jgi:hypothetical protein